MAGELAIFSHQNKAFKAIFKKGLEIFSFLISKIAKIRNGLEMA